MPTTNAILDRIIQSGARLGLAAQADINQPDDAEKIGYTPDNIWSACTPPAPISARASRCLWAR